MPQASYVAVVPVAHNVHTPHRFTGAHGTGTIAVIVKREKVHFLLEKSHRAFHFRKCLAPDLSQIRAPIIAHLRIRISIRIQLKGRDMRPAANVNMFPVLNIEGATSTTISWYVIKK